MILKEIYLYFNELHFSPRANLPRDTESRWVCNYLERKMQKQKFVTKDFRRLVVCGMEDPLSECYLASTNVLSVFVPFSLEEYHALSKEQIPEYYIGMLKDGFAKCNEQHEIPLDTFSEGIEEFRARGYKNKWTWKKKAVRELGVIVAFDCEMTMDQFSVELKVYRGTKFLFSEPVFEYPPDELVFGYDLKGVDVDGSIVRILGKSGRPTFQIELATKV